jgi:molybdopterin-guanine dinucleotide biosynthesis protein A
MSESSLRLGGIILCGGQSTRMGSPKALLPIGPTTMLQFVAERLAKAVTEIVIVAAASQQLPALPNCRVVYDAVPDRGPVEGLRAGLSALSGTCDAAYITACDTPLLLPEVVAFLGQRLGDADAIAPLDGDQPHPLIAIYRTSLVLAAENLLQAGRPSLRSLLASIRTRWVDIAEFRQIDPELLTFQNINSPEDYRRVLQLLES